MVDINKLKSLLLELKMAEQSRSLGAGDKHFAICRAAGNLESALMDSAEELILLAEKGLNRK